ncbi:MAG: hypothetical protein RBR35_18490 [Salinivirgaceae bacterium]|nr:hypothetical protein [Salinivirgaceae bacterium]
MEISTVASQALAVKEQMTQVQLGLAAVKDAADMQQKMADMLAKNATVVPPSPDPQPGGFSTYA